MTCSEQLVNTSFSNLLFRYALFFALSLLLYSESYSCLVLTASADVFTGYFGSCGRD